MAGRLPPTHPDCAAPLTGAGSTPATCVLGATAVSDGDTGDTPSMWGQAAAATRAGAKGWGTTAAGPSGTHCQPAAAGVLTSQAGSRHTGSGCHPPSVSSRQSSSSGQQKQQLWRCLVHCCSHCCTGCGPVWCSRSKSEAARACTAAALPVRGDDGVAALCWLFERLADQQLRLCDMGDGHAGACWGCSTLIMQLELPHADSDSVSCCTHTSGFTHTTVNDVTATDILKQHRAIHTCSSIYPVHQHLSSCRATHHGHAWWS